MKKVVSLLGVALGIGLLTSCGGSGAAGPGGGGGGGGGGGTCAFTFCATTSNTWSPSTATITAGSTVTWNNSTGQLHNVTFTTAGAAAAKQGDGTGTIGDFPDGTHSRKFDTPGSYPFTCTIHPGTMTGTLTVQ